MQASVGGQWPCSAHTEVLSLWTAGPGCEASVSPSVLTSGTLSGLFFLSPYPSLWGVEGGVTWALVSILSIPPNDTVLLRVHGTGCWRLTGGGQLHLPLLSPWPPPHRTVKGPFVHCCELRTSIVGNVDLIPQDHPHNSEVAA